MAGCSRTFMVPLQFRPDETGTTIIQTLKDVVEVK